MDHTIFLYTFTRQRCTGDVFFIQNTRFFPPQFHWPWPPLLFFSQPNDPSMIFDRSMGAFRTHSSARFVTGDKIYIILHGLKFKSIYQKVKWEYDTLSHSFERNLTSSVLLGSIIILNSQLGHGYRWMECQLSRIKSLKNLQWLPCIILVALMWEGSKNNDFKKWMSKAVCNGYNKLSQASGYRFIQGYQCMSIFLIIGLVCKETVVPRPLEK